MVAVGLSRIFGVTRIVNFAHGAFYMVGVYIAIAVMGKLSGLFGETLTGLAFWGGIVASAALVAVLGALTEIFLLRRIYQAPELFQLLATFALTLVFKDATLYIWGAEDILGPRAPGLSGSVEIFGQPLPSYDLFLIVVGPLLLGALWLLLTKTRWGTLIRAATQDRAMVGALGVNQALLFTGVFALGAFLAGLGGALQVPREPAALGLDVAVISDAFVVVVVGGLGSIPGAFLAALLIGLIKSFCIGIGSVTIFGVALSLSKFTLVAEFVVMALVLIWRPNGLLGKPLGATRIIAAHLEKPYTALTMPARAALGVLLAALLILPLVTNEYTAVLATDIFVFALFAVSLHFLMGPGGMVSFGHAAYFGLGAYGAGLLLLKGGVPMEAALFAGPLAGALGALLFGWFCVRLSGVYLAMLTLAFAQIVWSIAFQWDSFTGGSNGLVGIWPAEWLKSKTTFYYLTLLLTAMSAWLIRRVLFAPLGYAMRAGRDSPLRAEAIGIDHARVQIIAFMIAGASGGLAGALYAFSKGSISPDTLGVGRSIDGLVMVLLGGVQTLLGPIVGAAAFTWLQDVIARNTDYWRAILGGTIIALVLLFPQGLAGFFGQLMARLQGRRNPSGGVA